MQMGQVLDMLFYVNQEKNFIQISCYLLVVMEEKYGRFTKNHCSPILCSFGNLRENGCHCKLSSFGF